MDGERVAGVVAGEMGKSPDGTPGPAYEPGMELLGKYVLIGEGVRGSLAKQLIARYGLAEGREPQKYGLGMKEIWEVRPEAHRPGQVTHTLGWPLGRNWTTSSGTKHTSWTSSTALLTPKCRRTCQYCMVSAWLWLWFVVVCIRQRRC